MMWFLKMVGRALVSALAWIVLFVAITVAMMGFVEGKGTWQSFMWLLALATFGRPLVRCVVWIDDWADGDRKKVEPPQPEQSRKPEQLNLWNAP